MRIIRGFFSVLFIGVLSCSFSQLDASLYAVDSVPSLEALHGKLSEYYREQAVAELGLYTYVERWQWLKYAPTFGWNFTLNSPVIGWNSNDLFSAINYKRKKQAYVTSYLKKLNQAYNIACIRLNSYYDIFGMKQRVYLSKIKVLELEYSYMQIITDQYHKHEITPSDYIKKQINYESKIIDLELLKFELMRLKIDILELAFFSDNIQLFTDLEHVPTD